MTLLVLAGCRSPEAPPRPAGPGRWHVDDGWVRAPDGRIAVLRGTNVASAHKSSPYLGFHTAEDYARIREEWGWESVRFLMTWAAVEPEDGVVDTAYLDEVARRLDLAHDAGLVVTLDLHQDVYGPGFGFDGMPEWTCDARHYDAFVPAEPWMLSYLSPEVQACFDGFWASDDLKQRFVNAWGAVAARFAEHPAVIGFDPLNEPHWGSAPAATIEGEVWPALVEDVVARVRSEAPGWLAFVEPLSSRNLGVATAMPPFSFPDAVYAPHSYDAAAEQGDGFDPARREAIMRHVGAVAREAEALGGALWIGEYGGTGTSPGIAEYMDAELDAFDGVFAGATQWAFDADGGYGLYDEAGMPKAALLDALLRPVPARISGEPGRAAWEGGTFTLEWTGDGGPTEVRVPPSLFPDGWDTRCDGCEAEETTGGVEARADGPAVLVLSPR